MKTIIHKFTETGEVREPKPNEHFLMDEYLPKSVIASWDGRGDIQNSYPILTYERIEETWKPKSQDNYFYITEMFKVYNDMFVIPTHLQTNVHTERYRVGNCFPTKELAEEKLKQIKEILK